ncbi:MAG TPA: P pilus assembly/Cpx signaling pathway, periplasmic inhibitor/zinc-resistance associated protein [Cyanophyceae cyanobacterium]
MMKVRFLPMLAGAIALTLAAAPFVANAQAITPHSQRLLLAEGQGRGQGLWEQLNLTQRQKDQLARIRQQTRAQIDALLTPAQRQQYQSMQENNQGRRGGLRSLNLTEEQRTQVRQIMESAKSQSQAVLTTQQQAQLRQLRQQWRQQHPQHQQRQQQNQ